MKFKLPAETFPPLVLSPQDVASITSTADRIVAETTRAFDAMVANNRELPRDQWKFVKTHENLSVYKSRKSVAYAQATGSTSTSGWTPQPPQLLSQIEFQQQERNRARKASALGYATSPNTNPVGSSSTSNNNSYLDRLECDDDDSDNDEDDDNCSAVQAVKPPRTPLVVVTGTYVGSVEDSALGNLADTETAWKLRSAFIGDERDDYKLLATLQRPTRADPFRFLGIKWSTKRFAWLTAQRDLLFVESAGVIRDRSTNAILMGYNLIHSIDLASVPDLRRHFDIVRVKLSICFLTRPLVDSAGTSSSGTVELFCRGFTAPGGAMLPSLATAVYANAVLHATNVIACAQAKKLMWLTQQQRRRQQQQQQQQQLQIDRHVTHCHACARRLTGLSGLLRTASACRCCRRMVCRKCSVDVTLVIDITQSAVTRCALPFCLACVLTAKQLSARAIATASVSSSGDCTDASSASSSSSSNRLYPVES